MSLPQSIVRFARYLLGWYSADQYSTGDGIVSPKLGWESRIPYGKRLDFNPNFTYGHTATISIGLGQDRTRLVGNGCTLKYVGSGTIQNQISITAPTNSASALERCKFVDFRLDLGSGANQALNGIYARSAHHLTIDAEVINAGTSVADACTIIACTKPKVKFDCDGGPLVNAGNTNFARGLVIDGLFHAVYGYVVTTVGTFDVHIGHVRSNSLDVNGCFSCNFSGAGENSVGGWGLICGSGAADLNFFGVDLEGSGPLGFNGAHQAVWIKSGAANINFSGTKSFDGFIQVDSGAANIMVVGGTWGGMTNSTTGGITLAGVSGISPTQGSFGGVYTNVDFRQRQDLGPDLHPDCIIGSGTNGMYVNWSQFGGMTIFDAAAGIGSISTKYALYSIGTTTQLNGSSQSAMMVSNTPVLQAFATHADFSQPLAPASCTVATLPSGGNGRIMWVTNGRNVGEGAGSGTGVNAQYSNSQWRRSDNTIVAA